MTWEKNRDKETWRRDERGGRDGEIATVAEAQGGVASLSQLRHLGLSQRATEYRALQGRLHRLHRGVFAIGHRSIGRVGELRAAALACGDGAVISHGTAASFWGLRDQRPVLIDVTVLGQAGRKIDGVRCRRCRYPDEEEILLQEDLPITSPARTMVDLAGMLGNASLRKVVERAAMLELLDLKALDAAMWRAQRRRGVPALRKIREEWRPADDSVPDLRSDFEALVLPRLLASGLAEPACNETLCLDGERLTVDFLWAERRVVVETDGRRTHGTPVAFQRDRRRDQILIAAGYRVARVTWDQMRHEPDEVVGRISRALAST